MRRFKFICILTFFAFGLQGQWVDSASVSFNNDTLTIHIEGDVFIYDFDAIENIVSSINNDTSFVNVIFFPCSALQQLAPYDTTFKVIQPFPKGLNHIKLLTIIEKDTIGTCHAYANDEIFDTVYLSFNVPLSNTELDLHTQFKPFPNPTRGMVSFDQNTPLDKVTVLSATGQIIKTVYPKETYIDLSNYKPGVYILRFYYDELIETHKLIKL